MPDPQPENLSFSASISAARGKLITTLVVIALLMGIAAEALSLLTGFYNLRKIRCEAASAAMHVEAEGAASRPNRRLQFIDACLN